MPWLDDLPDCCIDDETGFPMVGLQLILLSNDTNDPKVRMYHNTVTKRKIWMSVSGIRITIQPRGIHYLESWPSIKHTVKFSDDLLKKNEKFIVSHTKRYNALPKMDYMDHMYLQYGLDGSLWEEFPKGVPGVIVDNTMSHENIWGWVHVIVSRSCPFIPPTIKTPHYAILTW